MWVGQTHSKNVLLLLIWMLTMIESVTVVLFFRIGSSSDWISPQWSSLSISWATRRLKTFPLTIRRESDGPSPERPQLNWLSEFIYIILECTAFRAYISQPFNNCYNLRNIKIFISCLIRQTYINKSLKIHTCMEARNMFLFYHQYSATGGQRRIPPSLATTMETKNPRALVREQ